MQMSDSGNKWSAIIKDIDELEKLRKSNEISPKAYETAKEQIERNGFAELFSLPPRYGNNMKSMPSDEPSSESVQNITRVDDPVKKSSLSFYVRLCFYLVAAIWTISGLTDLSAIANNPDATIFQQMLATSSLAYGQILIVLVAIWGTIANSSHK